MWLERSKQRTAAWPGTMLCLFSLFCPFNLVLVCRQGSSLSVPQPTDKMLGEAIVNKHCQGVKPRASSGRHRGLASRWSGLLGQGSISVLTDDGSDTT